MPNFQPQGYNEDAQSKTAETRQPPEGVSAQMYDIDEERRRRRLAIPRGIETTSEQRDAAAAEQLRAEENIRNVRHNGQAVVHIIRTSALAAGETFASLSSNLRNAA